MLKRRGEDEERKIERERVSTGRCLYMVVWGHVFLFIVNLMQHTFGSWKTTFTEILKVLWVQSSTTLDLSHQLQACFDPRSGFLNCLAL